MTGPDIHPEELIERARHGELTAIEHARLARHCEQCPACAMERALASDVATAAMQVPDALQVDTWVDRALTELEGDDRGTEHARDREGATASGGRESGRGRLASAIVGVLTLTVTASAAAYGAHSLGLVEIGLLGGAASNQTTTTAPPREAVLVGDAGPGPGELGAGGLGPGELGPGELGPGELGDSSFADAGSGEPRGSSDGAGAAEPSVSARDPQPSNGAQDRRPSAADLFRDANRARREGDVEEGLRLYRALGRRYPDSMEARVSHVAVGKLHLRAGRPSEAQRAFDQYLARGDASLRLEALVGRATALRQQGRRDLERETLERIVAGFPSSVHAARAREQLGR